MMTSHKAIFVSKIAHRLYGYTESLLGTSRFEITVKNSGTHFNVIRNIRYLSYKKL